MEHTTSPDIAAEAVALRRARPDLSAIQILDTVMHGRRYRLAEFAGVLPTSEFGQLLAEAFAPAARTDWHMLGHAGTSLAAAMALLTHWNGQVIAEFAIRYGMGV